MPLVKNQIIRLTIEGISSDGNGLGRHEGQVVFVPNTAPQDEADVKIVRPLKKYAFGKLLQLHQKSPLRIESDCAVSNTCGGCCFRHLRYETELLEKEGFVTDALCRIGKLQVESLPILPSPIINAYRNKVQYPVAQGTNGRLQYGFFAGRSHRLVPCENCMLQPPILNQIAAKAIQELENVGVSAYDETTHRGLLRHLCLRQSRQSEKVLLTLVINGSSFTHDKRVAKNLMQIFPQIEGVLINTQSERNNVIFGSNFRLLCGNDTIEDTLCDVPQRLSAASFSQVNPAAAERLFQTARNFANLQETDTLLDLYCGTGVIGLSMAQNCKALVGVEIVQTAVESARQSALSMGISHARFLCMDATAAATKLLQENFKADVALVDPPRKGCDEAVLQALLQMSPRKIVMISCNPATLARDLAMLTQHGYWLKKVQAVDMFPRTRHVESVAELCRMD